MKSGISKRGLFWMILLAGPPLLLLLVACGIRWNFKYRLEKYRDSLVARGEKLGISELRGKVPPPGAYATASLLQRSSDVGSKGPQPMAMVVTGKARRALTQDRFITLGGRETNSWELFQKQLDPERARIEEIVGAALKAAPDWGVDYQLGNDLNLGYLAMAKSSGTLLLASAMEAIHAGHPSKAVDRILAMISIANGLCQGRTTISLLVGQSVIYSAMQATWEVTHLDLLQEQDLLRIQNAWRGLDVFQGLVAASEMERAMGLDTIQRCQRDPLYARQALGNMAAAAGNPPQVGDVWESILEFVRGSGSQVSGQIRYLLWRWIFSYEDERRFLEKSQATIDQARALAGGKPFSLSTPGGAPTKPNDDGGLRIGGHWEGFYPFSDTALSGGWRIAYNAARAVAIQRLAYTALALRRCSTLPTTLGALVPHQLESVPLDPLDGNTLRYRIDSSGLPLLYSVGENLQDDGGDGSLPANHAGRVTMLNARDIVWPRVATPTEIEAAERQNKRR